MKRNTKQLGLKLSIAALALSVVIPNAAHAATLDDVVNAINGLGKQINFIVLVTAKAITDLIYEFNPSAPITVAGDIRVPEAAKAAKTTNNQLLQQSVSSQISMLNPQEQARRTIELKKLVNIQQPPLNPGGIIPANLINAITTLQNKAEGNVFSADSLIAPSGYTDTQEKNARDFINFISDAAEPLTKLTPQQVADIPNKETNQTYLEYIVALRSMVAARSVALNNFYHLYAERKVIPGLGTKVALPDEKGGIKQDASPLEVSDYLASRRIASAEWHREMATASTHTLLNELVALEAENRYEMHEMRKDIGRLIATLSVVELKAVKIEKLNLMQLEGQLMQPAMISKATETSTQEKTTLEKARELGEKLRQAKPGDFKNMQQDNANSQDLQNLTPEQIMKRLQPQQ